MVEEVITNGSSPLEVQANGMATYFVTLTMCLGLWCGRIYLLDILSPSNGMAEYCLCDSFFWRTDIYKSSMENRRKLQIPCLELRLSRIVLFTKLNLYINFNLFFFNMKYCSHYLLDSVFFGDGAHSLEVTKKVIVSF